MTRFLFKTEEEALDMLEYRLKELEKTITNIK